MKALYIQGPKVSNKGMSFVRGKTKRKSFWKINKRRGQVSLIPDIIVKRQSKWLLQTSENNSGPPLVTVKVFIFLISGFFY